MNHKDFIRKPGAKLPTDRPYPTAEQLRRLLGVIECESDYSYGLAERFGDAVLALWGASGYVQTHQPTEAQLSILALPLDEAIDNDQ